MRQPGDEPCRTEPPALSDEEIAPAEAVLEKLGTRRIAESAARQEAEGVPPFLAVRVSDVNATPFGIVRYDVERGCLIYDSDDPELLREMVEERCGDYAYGRELRRLTDAELLEHLPRRLN